MSNAPNGRGSAARKPLQFSLRGLLIAMVGIATVLAILFQWGAIVGGLCGFVVGIALLVYAMWCDRALASPAAVLALLAGCMSLLWIAAPVELSRRSACVVNLKQIALALHNYHDTYGTFPPAYVADEDGRPMHSWRVLILPFLESSDVYSKYRFDEPWDGPHNRLLADRMPYAYRCPSESRTSPPSHMTSYVAVVGPETVWPGRSSRSLGELTDGAGNTLLVVESHCSGIHWMEPRDLSVYQMARTINARGGQGICSCHGASQRGSAGLVAHAVLADASARVLPSDLAKDRLQALLTIAGGEDAPLD
jgi:hypothetical protein